MNEMELVESTILEYRNLFEPSGEVTDKVLEIERIKSELARNHDWTRRGADALVTLACEYGAFMLRNALALAIVLQKEDGDLEF